jgi:histidine triad (HIT) family protein
MEEDCIFCKIVKGKVPSTKLYEDEKVLAFLDIQPAAKGHALVIPKKHYRVLLDMPHEELEAVMKAVQKVASAIMVSEPGVQGFNVIQSNGEVAGQVIPHVHFHIVPRRAEDSLSFEWQRGKAEEGELKKYAEIVKEKMG